MKRVLVTGGAGYIGAHACKALARAGYLPITFDNLSTGWADAVRFGPLEEGCLLERARLAAVFAEHKPDAVMHFAALSLVGEAMSEPGRYWRTNLIGALNLIEAALAAGCRDFIFSSTCATYGAHDGVMLDEGTTQTPLNSYGKSKRAIEEMLTDFATSDGLRPVIFRYFNVAGADPEAEIGERHEPETHLIPLVLDAALGLRPALTIHGTDYPTPDGTCLRDYVHVSDLADAHVLGLKRLEAGGAPGVFCLGSGRGFSVREVIAEARCVSKRGIAVVEGPRRAGDAAMLVSGSTRAEAELGWRPARGELSTMIADAWRWHQALRTGTRKE